MKINYWRLFIAGLALLAALILLRWIHDAAGGILDLLPSRAHAPNYNMAAVGMLAITTWDIVRLLKQS